ncbi:MAG: glycosyltransferase family 2 protein [Bacteroidaceae bacterium]|nr:glycosyltransferase family 2 protein [Prevotellaceae bacterium]MDY5632706.1 glycosyltransferase family 2 protein [Bacteroidaceae bacterium]
MSTPVISIVMPFYNSEKHIKESLKSIVEQSYKDIEIILINDGSSDNSIKIIESFNDKRIKVIHNRHDFISSLNLGLETAVGKYIARMDSDDIMHPDRLLVQHRIMEQDENIDFCSTWCIFFDDMTCKASPYRTLYGKIDSPLVKLLKNNIFVHSSMMFRRDFVNKKRLRYQNYKYAEDYKLWVEAAKLGARFFIEPQFLLYYRTHTEQVSNKYCVEQEQCSLQIREEILHYLYPRMPPKLQQLNNSIKAIEKDGIVKIDYRLMTIYNMIKLYKHKLNYLKNEKT